LVQIGLIWFLTEEVDGRELSLIIGNLDHNFSGGCPRTAGIRGFQSASFSDFCCGGLSMLDTALLASIAQQMMASDKVDVNGELVTVSRTSKHRLRTLAFTMDGREYQAIEQNAEKPSRWGRLAREGHQVVQFKDSGTNRFVAVSVDGEVTVYGAGHGARKQ
jgi:hypothetical protein